MKLLKLIVAKWTEKARLRAELEAARNAQGARLKMVQKDRDDQSARAAALALELDLAQGRLGKLAAARRPHVVKVPERAMTPAQISEALAVDDDEPLWRAIHQTLDGAISDAMDQTSARPAPDPRSGVVTTTAEVRTFHAGGVEHLRDLQDKLLDLRAKAVKQEEAAEAEEDKSE